MLEPGIEASYPGVGAFSSAVEPLNSGTGVPGLSTEVPSPGFGARNVSNGALVLLVIPAQAGSHVLRP